MRRTLLAAAVALGLLAPGAAAAPSYVSDPPGDVLPGFGPGYDVVSADLRVGWKVRYDRGRWVRVPVKLVVTVTYAGDLPADPHAVQVVRFRAGRCRVVLERFAAGQTFGSSSCRDGEVPFSAYVSGPRLTITLPVTSVGAEHLAPGGVVQSFSTYTSVGDPLLGYDLYVRLGGWAGAADEAYGTVPYAIT